MKTTTAQSTAMYRSWTDWAPLPLRLILGFGLMFHGFPKLFSGAGHEQFVGMLQNIGVPAPGLMAYIVGIVEFFGGLAIFVGAFIAIVAAFNIVNMLVAMFSVHLPHGFNFMNITGMSESGPVFGVPGFEVNLLYIAGLAALILGGAGAYSIDRLRANRGSSARSTA